ncbi:hypothetical protein EJ05DRAFT_505659 [Pseudovirgaria hyperparasitica]|uniref:C2H2-type domain-containing protein n=1 Tax=Pseudovirgaria hyperparasitica TaxID=470096 RepID=A0A6A6VSV1_9PEZI|nr:uncharacterized protein EJ05DRAFT_505659 [Pseudovirgaria hyperparasitica]KAF2752834.1 hypothetical protein EJ05DRAFT_505659 [Pseudovirgaria hyperparasitica]
MAPRRRLDNKDAKHRSAEYYISQRKTFNKAEVNVRNHSPSTRTLKNLVHKKWEEYFRIVDGDAVEALKNFEMIDIYGFFDWWIEESCGSFDACSTLQTYWNVLGLVRHENFHLMVDPTTKEEATNARQSLAVKHRLRKEPKEKPIMRAEDEFECLQTLWSSREIIFDLELHRLVLALIIQLAGITGNRPKALLTLRYRHVQVALLPDPRGGSRPRVLIELKFEQTKGYLGQKDANTIPVPDILNETCLMLCPHITLLALAFRRGAFAVPDLTPAQFYDLKVLPGQRQQLIPWKEEVQDDYLFPRSVKTSLGIEVGHDHLPYDSLRQRLAKIGEVTGMALPVGAYCFRRGNGEALDSSSHISEAQRNLCLQHGPNSAVFQRNYLSRHITADTQAAFRGLEPQTDVMRVATGMSRTIDKRRPTRLNPEQQEEAHRHPRVQKLLREKLDLKAQMKDHGRTVKSFEGTALYDRYRLAKQAYEGEYIFQQRSLLRQMKQVFNSQQPVFDIESQIRKTGSDNEDGSKSLLSTRPELIPERVAALEALLQLVPSSPGSEHEDRAKAVQTLVELAHVQDGHPVVVRRQARRLLSPLPAPERPLSLDCKPLQCFLCLGNAKNPVAQRSWEFHSRGDLKKHLLRHAQKHEGKWPLTCPIDGERIIHQQHLLSHAHAKHKTPLIIR